MPHSFPHGEPNLMLEVHQQFKGQGIKVLMYIYTAYGSRDLDEVRADIDRQR